MKAELQCPKCGHKEEKTVPEDKCIPFYRCNGCETIIRVKDECCVFCAYSDKKCPVSR